MGSILPKKKWLGLDQITGVDRANKPQFFTEVHFCLDPISKPLAHNDHGEVREENHDDVFSSWSSCSRWVETY